MYLCYAMIMYVRSSDCCRHQLCREQCHTYQDIEVMVKGQGNRFLLYWCIGSEEYVHQMSHVVRKPVYAIYEQQRHRSACASVQSDQHLCCSLPRQFNISCFFTCNFMTLANVCS